MTRHRCNSPRPVMTPSFALLALSALLSPSMAAADTYASHPPIREMPKPSNRPLAEGPAKFVDATTGSDTADGSEKAPWKTINHALKQLSPGDTLYLRKGSYFENVYCAI